MTQLNYNNLKSNSFDFRVTGLPGVQFKTTMVTLPGVQLPGAEVPWKDSNQYFTGDQLMFEPLVIEFIVDEDLANYSEIRNWIYSSAKGIDQYNDYRDGIVSILTSASNYERHFTYKNLFPESISALQFRTNQGSDIEYVTCEVSFRYSEVVLSGT